MSQFKMGMLNILCILGFLAFPFSHDSHAAEFSSSQKKEIEMMIHDYLLNHPQILVEASQALQKQEFLAMQQHAQEAIINNANLLFHDPVSPKVGNSQGTIALVEFFDYQCGHCKRVAPVIANLLQKQPQTFFILKQMPIFGAVSEYAAKAVLAAQKQQKAWELHQALMLSKKPLSEKIVLDLASSVGINANILKQDMQNPAYDTELKNNLLLAEKLGITGSPAFIIAAGVNTVSAKNIKSKFILGAADQAILEKAIIGVHGG